MTCIIYKNEINRITIFEVKQGVNWGKAQIWIESQTSFSKHFINDGGIRRLTRKNPWIIVKSNFNQW